MRFKSSKSQASLAKTTSSSSSPSSAPSSAPISGIFSSQKTSKMNNFVFLFLLQIFLLLSNCFVNCNELQAQTTVDATAVEPTTSLIVPTSGPIAVVEQSSAENDRAELKHSSVGLYQSVLAAPVTAPTTSNLFVVQQQSKQLPQLKQSSPVIKFDISLDNKSIVESGEENNSNNNNNNNNGNSTTTLSSPMVFWSPLAGKSDFKPKVFTPALSLASSSSSPSLTVAQSGSSVSKPAKRFFRKKVTTIDDPKRKFSYRKSNKPITVNSLKVSNTVGAGAQPTGAGHVVRRSDSELNKLAPTISSQGAIDLDTNSDSAWWSRYLASPQGASLALANGAENGALGATLATQPDYVLHNPATQTLIANLAAQSSAASGGDIGKAENSELINLWLSRLYRNALPYIDYAMKVAAYQKMREQQEESKKQGFGNRIRALYGRNRLFRPKSPSQGFTDSESPFSTSGLSTSLSGLDDIDSSKSFMFSAKPAATSTSINAASTTFPSSSSSASLSESSNTTNQESFSASYVQPTYINFRPSSTNTLQRVATSSSSSSSSPTASASEFSVIQSPSPYRFSSSNYRSPKHHHLSHHGVSSRHHGHHHHHMHPFSHSSIQPSHHYSSSLQSQASQQSFVQRPLGSIIRPSSPMPWGVDNQRISMIKFNAQDGLSPIGNDAASFAETARKVIQFDEPESAASESSSSSTSSGSHRSPRRIKMGSFISARSADSGSDRTMKFDMSDIFCKDNFKPIFSEASNRVHINEPATPTRIAQKRSTVAHAESDKFVNSNWLPLHKNESSGIALSRSKRQASDESGLELPKGTQVKEVDGHTSQLLLNLLRANNPTAGFTGKKISTVYYVYLPKNQQSASTQGNSASGVEPTERRRVPPQQRQRITTTEAPQPSWQEEPVTPVPTRRPNRQRNQNRNRVVTTSTTTTTTTTRAPEVRPGFELTEGDYEFGEKLCEGRFSGSIADPRHNCQLYFTCNADTIDTYTCPDRYRFDAHSQLCQPAEKVKCQRI